MDDPVVVEANSLINIINNWIIDYKKEPEKYDEKYALIRISSIRTTWNSALEKPTPIVLTEEELKKQRRLIYVEIDVELNREKPLLTILSEHIPLLNNLLKFIDRYFENEVDDTVLSKLYKEVRISFKAIIKRLHVHFKSEYLNGIKDENIREALRKLQKHFSFVSLFNRFYELLDEMDKVDPIHVTLDNLVYVLYPFRKVLEASIAEICPCDIVAHIIELKRIYGKD